MDSKMFALIFDQNFNCEDLQTRDDTVQLGDDKVVIVPVTDFQVIITSILDDTSRT